MTWGSPLPGTLNRAMKCPISSLFTKLIITTTSTTTITTTTTTIIIISIQNQGRACRHARHAFFSTSSTTTPVRIQPKHRYPKLQGSVVNQLSPHILVGACEEGPRIVRYWLVPGPKGFSPHRTAHGCHALLGRASRDEETVDWTISLSITDIDISSNTMSAKG